MTAAKLELPVTYIFWIPAEGGAVLGWLIEVFGQDCSYYCLNKQTYKQQFMLQQCHTDWSWVVLDQRCGYLQQLKKICLKISNIEELRYVRVVYIDWYTF